MRASLGSSKLSEQKETIQEKRQPHQSVLQHMSYGEDNNNRTLSSLSKSFLDGPRIQVQTLAPASNYLYRGSNARKTVRDLLDARQETDAALLYEAITKKKFDVPVNKQPVFY